MKLKIFSVMLLFCVGLSIVPNKASAQGGSVSFQVFYDDLSPYGTWINSPQYGYVWMPNVSAGFTPYSTNGYWTFTDEGWTWVSNYPWGWAPFHYGRWYNDITYGPMWIPGNEWGPGWVSWRSSGSYYGWAPMGPGVSIDMAYGSGYYDTYNQYTFVRAGYMGNRNIHEHYENRTSNTTIINTTTVINNNRVDKAHGVTYSAGPQQAEVEKHVGRSIAPVIIKESNKPGQVVSDNQLQIYRPQVQKNGAGENKPAPTKVAELKDVKPMGERERNAAPQKANQPTKQQSAPSQQATPAKRTEGAKPSQQVAPTRNMDGEKQQPTARPAPQQKQPLRNDLPPHQQPNQPQNSNIPRNMGGEKQPQNTGRPTQAQPTPQRPTQQSEPQRAQPNREQPRQQQTLPQQNSEQPRQQPQRTEPQQPQRNAQPPQQQPSQPQQNREQPQRSAQPPQQQPQQHSEPPRQQQAQPQQNREQPRQQQAPQQHNNPGVNPGRKGPN